MRMLAIECATEACSLALFEDGVLCDARHELLGRGHAEHLIPLIAGLPHKGRASEIRVSLGPGSFTGVRIGLAAARALGLAWDAKVVGFPTLALVAATARNHRKVPVSVCMAGGHGEWFIQNFDATGLPQDLSSAVREDAVNDLPSHYILAGNRAVERAAPIAGQHEVLTILPDARFVPDMPDSLLQTELSPSYGRAPDAKPPS